jgi:phosphoribosyl-ATP pyrophosphohydrolase
MSNIFSILVKTIKKNKKKESKNSYTSFLFKKGTKFCLRKLKEEFFELVDAFKKNNKKNIIYESADLIYFKFVLYDLSQDLTKLNESYLFDNLYLKMIFIFIFIYLFY